MDGRVTRVKLLHSFARLSGLAPIWSKHALTSAQPLWTSAFIRRPFRNSERCFVVVPPMNSLSKTCTHSNQPSLLQVQQTPVQSQRNENEIPFSVHHIQVRRDACLGLCGLVRILLNFRGVSSAD